MIKCKTVFNLVRQTFPKRYLWNFWMHIFTLILPTLFLDHVNHQFNFYLISEFNDAISCWHMYKYMWWSHYIHILLLWMRVFFYKFVSFKVPEPRKFSDNCFWSNTIVHTIININTLIPIFQICLILFFFCNWVFKTNSR